MAQYRADFNVKSTLVLPPTSPTMKLAGQNPTFEIVISNAELDSAGHIPALDVQVISSSESMDAAPHMLRSLLAQQLDILTFVTNSAFEIKHCYRVMEWDAHQKKRKCNIIEKFDAFYPPEPQLDIGFLNTAQSITEAKLEEYQERALKYFRYGLIANQPEDQFQNFWLAIEIIAEGRKEKEASPIPCGSCDGVLACNKCGHIPQKIPMPKPEIRKLIATVVKDNPKKMFDDLDEARNALLHGRLSKSLEKKIGRPLTVLVDDAGLIAWHVIASSIPLKESFVFGHRDGKYVNNALLVRANLEFEHKDNTEHPEKVPGGKIEMNVRLGKPLEPESVG